MEFSAVILCGGRSRRMGRDKALLPVNGEPLLMRQIRLVWSLKPTELFLSVRAEAGAVPNVGTAENIQLLPDAHPECGPLGGIATALESISTNHVLFLAVDMPRMSAKVLRSLLAACSPYSGAAPRLNNLIEPLAAVYHRESLPIALRLIAAHRYSVRAFAEGCKEVGQLACLDIAAADRPAFENWNCPEDLIFD